VDVLDAPVRSQQIDNNINMNQHKYSSPLLYRHYTATIPLLSHYSQPTDIPQIIPQYNPHTFPQHIPPHIPQIFISATVPLNYRYYSATIPLVPAHYFSTTYSTRYSTTYSTTFTICESLPKRQLSGFSKIFSFAKSPGLYVVLVFHASQCYIRELLLYSCG
jgi:hypothetical protein